MTELNDEHHGEPAQRTLNWPAAGTQSISDPQIASIVEALDGVASKPVAEHEAVYAELHDALLQALNDDAPNGEGRPEHGTA
jgi:hypothetical protein